MTNDESLILLTVRGKLNAPSLEAGCQRHNETAGSQPGIAAARALGDLSHQVFTPLPGFPGAVDGEVLFIDYWMSAEGIGRFFSDPQVQGMAAQLFAAREGVVWMPARGAFGFRLPAPVHKPDRLLGIVRGVAGSLEDAISIFRAVLAPKLPDARRRGQLSHQLFVRVPLPGESGVPELIGIDQWCDSAGMGEHYKEVGGVYKAFSAAPQTSVWQPGRGGVWSEW